MPGHDTEKPIPDRTVNVTSIEQASAVANNLTALGSVDVIIMCPVIIDMPNVPIWVSPAKETFLDPQKLKGKSCAVETLLFCNALYSNELDVP